MCGSLLLTAMMATGINAGWQPLPNGGMEYMVQIEPNTWDPNTIGSLGQSDVPPNVRDIRKLTISVGREILPQIDPPLTMNPTTESYYPPNPTSLRNGEYQGLNPTEPVQSPPLGDRRDTFINERGIDPDGLSDRGPWMSDPNESGGLIVPSDRPPPVFGEESLSEEEPPPNLSTKTENVVEDLNRLMPLTLTVAALVAALGGMLYLGIIAWDYRRRYRDLLRQLIERAGDGKLEVEAQI